MRRFSTLLAVSLFAGAAHAADIEIIEAVDIDPARFSWSGAYVGVSGGYGWLKDVDNAQVPPFPDEGSDWVLGAHVGYLHQFGNWVAGAEFEYNKLDIRFERAPFLVIGEDLYNLKARAGYAFDRFLVSGFIGASYATTNIALDDWGWMVGANLDYAITDNIVAGVQYSHSRYNNVDGSRIDARLDLLTARVGFKF